MLLGAEILKKYLAAGYHNNNIAALKTNTIQSIIDRQMKDE